MRITALTEEISSYLTSLPPVKSCRLYGSLGSGTFDRYSDIDLEVDVSGTDNGRFALELPGLLSLRFPVIFFDYAPSLAPEKYVVTFALDAENPFLLLDISCAAVPPCASVSPTQLRALNCPLDHALKLFSANVKHFLRGQDCRSDIEKMYDRLLPQNASYPTEQDMLRSVFLWLRRHAPESRQKYLDGFVSYLTAMEQETIQKQQCLPSKS